jgi:hypothetical protein
MIMHPSEATGVGLEFKDPQGHSRGQYFDIYLEPHDGGISIDIDKEYNLK